MYPALNFGPFVIPTAGLVYIIGAWISLSTIERAAKQLKLNPEPVYGVGATALFAGLLGARLTFVLIYWSVFRENLLGIIWPLNSGYNLWGGLTIGLISAFFYGRAKQLSLTQTIDALAPGLILGFIFISIADFLAGPGFGTLTRVPWAITQFSMRRHPVQIYEVLLGITALSLWYYLLKYRIFPGQLFLLTISIYSGGRLFLDAFRENTWISNSGLHIIQIISLSILLASLYLVGRLSDQATQKK